MIHLLIYHFFAYFEFVKLKMKNFMKMRYFFFSTLVCAALTACSGSGDAKSNLPSSAESFLNKHFPDSQMTSVETDDDNDVEVTLENGIRVKFDRRGTWEEINTKKNGLSESLKKLLPNQTLNYIAKNYPERSIRKVERKKYGYEVTLNKPNAISLKFTKGGAFIPEDEEVQ